MSLDAWEPEPVEPVRYREERKLSPVAWDVVVKDREKKVVVASTSDKVISASRDCVHQRVFVRGIGRG